MTRFVQFRRVFRVAVTVGCSGPKARYLSLHAGGAPELTAHELDAAQHRLW